MPSELTPFEREAIALLLAGDHPLLAALREQATHCQATKREFTGVGFFTDLAVPPDTKPIPLNRDRIVLNDVGAEWDGLVHGASLILFVDGGRLTLLEGFTYDDPWPEHIENWRVMPQVVNRFGGAETNLEQLNASWKWPDSDEPSRDIPAR